MSWWGWVLAYLGAGFVTSFLFLLHGALFDLDVHKRLTSYKATLTWMFNKDGGGLAALVGGLWPLVLIVFVVYVAGNIPAAIIWLIIRKRVLIGKGIDKLNRKAA